MSIKELRKAVRALIRTMPRRRLQQIVGGSIDEEAHVGDPLEPLPVPEWVTGPPPVEVAPDPDPHFIEMRAIYDEAFEHDNDVVPEEQALATYNRLLANIRKHPDTMADEIVLNQAWDSRQRRQQAIADAANPVATQRRKRRESREIVKREEEVRGKRKRRFNVDEDGWPI